jgi:hypothetical protein
MIRWTVYDKDTKDNLSLPIRTEREQFTMLTVQSVDSCFINCVKSVDSRNCQAVEDYYGRIIVCDWRQEDNLIVHLNSFMRTICEAFWTFVSTISRCVTLEHPSLPLFSPIGRRLISKLNTF